MNKRIFIYLISAILLLGMGASIAGYMLFLNRPLSVKEPIFLYIDDNDNADSVIVKLERNAQGKRIRGFRMLVSLSKYEENIHSGAYLLNANYSTWDIFRRLQYGLQTPVKVTVPSVRTMEQLIVSVSSQLMVEQKDLATLLNDSGYCAKIGYDRYTLPALFIPNTYEVYWNISADNFIARMQKEHQRFWNSERMAKARSISLTPVEIATLASIVDEETNQISEKPIVAGLYINRLKRGIPLQADPTVKFALQDFGLKRILYKHLETKSPYNTYLHAGLPPGPIRIASVSGMESVLNYAKHNYLYMCAKEDFSGFHNFASTLSQHQANAYRYQRELNKRKIR